LDSSYALKVSLICFGCAGVFTCCVSFDLHVMHRFKRACVSCLAQTLKQSGLVTSRLSSALLESTPKLDSPSSLGNPAMGHVRSLASPARRNKHPPPARRVHKATVLVMSMPDRELFNLLSDVLPKSWEQLWVSTETDSAALQGCSSSDPIVLVWNTFQAPSNATLKATWATVGSRVMWVQAWSSGVESLLPLVQQVDAGGDVPITNLRGAFSSTLAEWTLAAMLYFNKQLPRVVENRKTATWDSFAMNELRGRTVGFVGFGSIAEAAAKLCRAFGMRSLAVRRTTVRSAFAQNVTAEQLFAESDFVVCSLPATSETHNFFSTAQFSEMKPSAVFISIGRGSAVDEEALIKALEEKRIAGAALDVYAIEPLPKSSPLWSLENVLLTRHSSEGSAFQQNAGQVFKKHLDNFKAGQPFTQTVDRSSGY